MHLISKFYKITLILAIFTAFILVAEAQNRPYRVNDRQVKTLLTRIENRTDSFKKQMNTALNRSSLNNTTTENTINSYISDFENSTNALLNNFNSKTSVGNDVYYVLQRAATIDSFLKANRLNSTVQTQWRYLRNDLSTLSRYYNVAWNWNNLPANTQFTNNSQLAYTVPYNTMRSLITKLESNTNKFKGDLKYSLDRSSLNNTRSESAINSYIADFENSTDVLKRNFETGKSTDDDVEDILRKGYVIDGILRDYPMLYRAENQWKVVRNDLNSLANYYVVSINMNSQMPASNQFEGMLDGTYRLNANLSDDVNAVVESVTKTYYADNQRERVQMNLRKRLASPEYLAIDKNGVNVTVASNLSPQVTFQADGSTDTEYLGKRQVKVTGKTNYESVSLNYEGDKINDFYVSFMPMKDGRLKVLRRINLENRNEVVAVISIYDKINSVANYSWVSNQTNAQNNNQGVDYSTFFIPNGVVVEGTLNETLSTKTVKDGDKFTLSVTSPSQYSGAIIYGYVSNADRSGRVSGRANMTFNFEQIRLRNGNTYHFKGIVEEVVDARGNKVSVNNEGVVRDGSQTTKTVVRTGIGAALGAIIGAVINGGDGAAIGAAIGGGAGAGSVIAQGRDDLNLEVGSKIVIASTAPGNISDR